MMSKRLPMTALYFLVCDSVLSETVWGHIDLENQILGSSGVVLPMAFDCP
jgi:hypothetical protein